MPRPKRIAVVDNEEIKDRQESLYIQSLCPVNRSGVECIAVAKDQKGTLTIDENTCIGCGICVKANPKAIQIVNLPTALDEDPIHRYGTNLFALYKLPIPKQGMVVGLVGPNGIGKSTVLNILSGNLKPNLGRAMTLSSSTNDDKKQAGWEEIIEQFKGTELQAYLENIKNVKVGYKSQNIDAMQKMFSGKVGDLLKKVDKDENRFDKVIANFKLDRLLKKNINELSGGELQLIAIAATIIKGGNFYFFDEPSSYLDVEQRFLVAREIRSLAEGEYESVKNKQAPYVMTIDHDLAVADYLADQTHILYGAPGVFGIVSPPLGVRIGINAYLDGYIKEDNVRFRDKPIIFSRIAKSPEKKKVLYGFEEFEKTFSSFSLKVKSGELYQGEIIGILGANGIGKTTFVNMLAGEIKPDKGKPLELKLSYKPQRLVLNSDEKGMIVREFIGDASKVQNTIHMLKVDRLFEREMRTLSGGEMQAVFICAALARDHEILLLDEPSAFLDVEQRLVLAKVLDDWTKFNNIAGFVVDHDLQVIDSVSNRIMVFDGKPAIEGFGNQPENLKDGMNRFLEKIGITFRRDPQTGRPRANKLDSVLDREQKEKGQYYYS